MRDPPQPSASSTIASSAQLRTVPDPESLAKWEKHKSTDSRRIHPIIMYPFTQPGDMVHLKALYAELVCRLSRDKVHYCRPVTVLNNQTFHRNKLNLDFVQFLKSTVRQYSDIVTSWSVDTCQMWLTGFGHSYEQSKSDGDVFWLIPGDFNYAGATGQKVLDIIEDLPKTVYTGNCELCLGEIKVEPNSSKQLIDTYGTYGLLYNWFPLQAQTIRDITDKPRTEFFAINKPYLAYALDHRWYAYEQTIVMLLQGMLGRKRRRKIKTMKLGDISDEVQGRDSLGSAMQQVERTERVLKLYWREVNEPQDPQWPDKFRKLDFQSEQIRAAALVILEQILRGD